MTDRVGGDGGVIALSVTGSDTVVGFGFNSNQ